MLIRQGSTGILYNIIQLISFYFCLLKFHRVYIYEPNAIPIILIYRNIICVIDRVLLVYVWNDGYVNILLYFDYFYFFKVLSNNKIIILYVRTYNNVYLCYVIFLNSLLVFKIYLILVYKCALILTLSWAGDLGFTNRHSIQTHQHTCAHARIHSILFIQRFILPIVLFSSTFK